MLQKDIPMCLSGSIFGQCKAVKMKESEKLCEHLKFLTFRLTIRSSFNSFFFLN